MRSAAFPRFLVLVAALALLSVGCGDDPTAAGGGDSPAGLTDRTFIAQNITGYDLVEGTEIRLTFSGDEISAHAGCNHLFGQLSSVANGTLTVQNMGGTEMGCDAARHDQDVWLADFLTASPTWTLEGDELRIESADTEMVLVDRVVADPDRALEGTRWVVDSVSAGPDPDDPVSSTPSGATAWVVFTDGTFEGSTGCNSMSGRYEFDGDNIVVTERMQTTAGCLDPAVAQLEEDVAAVLAGTVTVEITADRLTLRGGDGRGLGLHAAE